MPGPAVNLWLNRVRGSGIDTIVGSHCHNTAQYTTLVGPSQCPQIFRFWIVEGWKGVYIFRDFGICYSWIEKRI
jgi:hypothetical protein